jgi:hypothetical protein
VLAWWRPRNPRWAGLLRGITAVSQAEEVIGAIFEQINEKYGINAELVFK